jgi:hypothetical protein
MLELFHVVLSDEYCILDSRGHVTAEGRLLDMYLKTITARRRAMNPPMIIDERRKTSKLEEKGALSYDSSSVVALVGPARKPLSIMRYISYHTMKFLYFKHSFPRIFYPVNPALPRDNKRRVYSSTSFWKMASSQGFEVLPNAIPQALTQMAQNELSSQMTHDMLEIVPICKEIGNLFIKKARLDIRDIPYPILTPL